MRGTKYVFITVFLIVSIATLLTVSDESESSSAVSLKITEVSPADEAVKIVNYGTVPVDLKGYVLTDGEGKLTFENSYVLKPGSYVIVSKSSGTDWFDSRPNVILFTHGSVAKSGSFVLADSGDEVSLLKGTSVIDAVCYGKSAGTDGWFGNPVGISSGQYLLRDSATDTDSASDWTATKPGWTTLEFNENVRFPAEVYPFVFPESNGIPVLNALSDATETIDVSVYLLSSPQVAALLCQKEKDGVEVRVLIEGTPLGVDISTELSLMKSLTDSGGEVRIIDYSGSDACRYMYVHNKYAVIDDEKVIITSENWTSGNIGEYGNRGWGAIIESVPYAGYMKNVFENDYSAQWGDVAELERLYPNLRAYPDLTYESPGPYGLNRYHSEIVPVMSPDNSLAALKKLMSGVNERLYAEQMDLGSSLSTVSGETPVSWMSRAASRGVDVKFILDSSQSNGSTHETYVNLIAGATSVQAVSVNGGDGFQLIHNKGIVMDGSVWIGSVNWTDNSFLRNRESAVLIVSEEVSDYFADWFLRDFGVNVFTVEENGLKLGAERIETPQGNKVLLRATGPSGYKYEWNLGNGEVRVSDNNLAIFDAPAPGTYTATVRMVELGLCESVEFTVEIDSVSGGSGIVSVAAVAAAGAVLSLGVAAYLVRSHGKSAVSYRCARYDPGRFR